MRWEQRYGKSLGPSSDNLRGRRHWFSLTDCRIDYNVCRVVSFVVFGSAPTLVWSCPGRGMLRRLLVSTGVCLALSWRLTSRFELARAWFPGVCHCQAERLTCSLIFGHPRNLSFLLPSRNFGEQEAEPLRIRLHTSCESHFEFGPSSCVSRARDARSPSEF